MSYTRASLAPISHSALNSRQSLAPGAANRMSLKPQPGQSMLGKPVPAQQQQQIQTRPRTSSIGSRMSLASAGSAGRRSSVMSRNVVQDPRPVGDKKYFAKCVQYVCDYLLNHGFEIAPKSIQSPMTKDFVNILTFMIQRVDPLFKLPGPKFDEESVIQIFRRFKYPLALSKRQLTSIGTPHTWPTLLAALTWLAELLSYEERAQMNKDAIEGDLTDEENNGEKLFFQYLEKAYGTFLAGEDNFSVLEEDLQKSFDQKNQVIMEEISRLIQENAKLEAELDEHKNSPSPLMELSAKKQTLQEDNQKFKQFLAELQSNKSQLEHLVQEKKAELDKLEKELAIALKERESLQYQFDNQELSPQDVERIMCEKNKLEEALHSVTQQKEDAHRANWNAEMQISAQLDDLSKLVHQFNMNASSLHIVPRTAKNADGKNFELQINRDTFLSSSINANSLDQSFSSADAVASSLLNLDLKQHVKPHLRKIKEGYIQKIHAKQEELMGVKDRFEQSEEQKQEQQEKIAALEATLRKRENAYQIEKKAMSDELNALSQETEAIEAEVQRLRASMNAGAVPESERMLERMRQEFEAFQNKAKQEKEMMHDITLRTLDMLTLHIAHVKDSFDMLEERLAQFKKDLDADN